MPEWQRDVTSSSSLSALESDALGALATALDALGLQDSEILIQPSETRQGRADATLHLKFDGQSWIFAIEVKAQLSPATAAELARRHFRSRLLVIGRRVTRAATPILEQAGISWLDMAGQLRLRAPGLLVDAPVPPSGGRAAADHRPISGRGGLAVAYWLCSHPERSMSPTRHAPDLGMSPATVSTNLRRLEAAGLCTPDRRGDFPELFWALAEAWKPDWVWLADPPEPSDWWTADKGTTWVRAGDVAAAHLGAPLVAVGQSYDLYVPGPVDITIASRKYGTARVGTGAAAVAVAPVREVVTSPEAGADDPWRWAPLLACALDLAQDAGRGREILSDWRAIDAVWI